MYENELSHAENFILAIEKIRARILGGVTEAEAVQILGVCDKMSKQSQNVDLELDVRDSIAVFLNSEQLILYLLLEFKDTTLPSSEEVRQLTLLPHTDRLMQFASLRQKYPYAVRTVHNPHLYLPFLQETIKVYGETKHPVELDWKHELGHFSRYLSQINGQNFQKETEEEFEFLYILHRDGDYLGYQPAVRQNESKLTIKERIDVVNEVGDLSEGDALAITELEKRLPFASLRQVVRKIFRK